jgi:hypothetical protein
MARRALLASYQQVNGFDFDFTTTVLIVRLNNFCLSGAHCMCHSIRQKWPKWSVLTIFR